MKINANWNTENEKEERIDLSFDRATINLSTKEAEDTFEKLSMILYGKVLKNK